MATADEFFQELTERQEPLLRNLSGTIRFDLKNDGTVERWFVTIHDGATRVSHKNAKADCVAEMDESFFEALTRGEANAISATLRGDIEIEGQPALLLGFQRLFPGPPATAGDQAEKIGSSR
jgi:putative sterol carrier protein